MVRRFRADPPPCGVRDRLIRDSLCPPADHRHPVPAAVRPRQRRPAHVRVAADVGRVHVLRVRLPDRAAAHLGVHRSHRRPRHLSRPRAPHPVAQAARWRLQSLIYARRHLTPTSTPLDAYLLLPCIMSLYACVPSLCLFVCSFVRLFFGFIRFGNIMDIMIDLTLSTCTQPPPRSAAPRHAPSPALTPSHCHDLTPPRARALHFDRYIDIICLDRSRSFSSFAIAGYGNRLPRAPISLFRRDDIYANPFDSCVAREERFMVTSYLSYLKHTRQHANDRVCA